MSDKIKQLTDKHMIKYAMAIFNNEVYDIFSFIEKFAKTEHIGGKNKADNSLNIILCMKPFTDTLKFLEKQDCIILSKKPKDPNNLHKYDLSKEYENLLSFDISINKQNFENLIKRKFCTEEYFFKKNKDRKIVFRENIVIILMIIGIFTGIVVSFAIYFLTQAANR